MADITVNAGFAVRKGKVNHISRPGKFSMSFLDSPLGPAPGAKLYSVDGDDVDLSMFTNPRACEIVNQDDTYSALWGVYLVLYDLFVPVGVLEPGWSNVITLPDMFGEFYEGTGTGTSASTAVRLRIKALGAPCKVYIGAFEA